MRRLIINADDFGLTSGVNRAIVEAHGHGVVTSATLMANAPAFSEAVQLAEASPRLGVGCHVVLVDGVLWLISGSSFTILPSYVDIPTITWLKTLADWWNLLSRGTITLCVC